MGARARVGKPVGVGRRPEREFGSEMLRLEVELSGRDRQLGVAGAIVDLRAVEPVAAGIGFLG